MAEIKFSEEFNKFKERLQTDEELRKHLEKCPLCNSTIEDRIITIYADLVRQLYEVYKWCGEKRVHEFKRKDIRHLMNHNGYARFGDFVRCSGGIIYKPKDDETGNSEKALFGMNMARAKLFFKGEREMPMQVKMNQITEEITVLRTAKIGEFPELFQLLNEKGLYDYERDLGRLL